MQYYKKIEIPNLQGIIAKCLAYVKTQKEIYYQYPRGSFRHLNFEELISHCPELMTAFSHYNIKPIHAVAIVVYRNRDMFVHIDHHDLDMQARVNIPLQNCNNTYTEFYTGGEKEEYVNPLTGITASKIVNATLVDRVEVDKATVLRVTEPHTVRIDERFAPRVTLSISFDKDPIFLLD